MALFKSLTFGNVNSMDYGVYITGSGVYNAPERAVEMFAIPGRNGALAIDGGRYENIEVTYSCGCFANTDAEFSEKIRAFRNAICSQYSYTRLTDEYNPDEYRMALYRSGLEAESFRSKAGTFEITFDCKPQRFLTSGESTYQIGEWGQTITQTGDIVTYQGDDLTAVKALTTDLEPIQDLHGYANPWPAGGGKNKLIYPYSQSSVTVNGVTATANSNGTVTVNGTCTAGGSYMWLYGSTRANLMPTLNEGETYIYSLEGAVNGLNGQVIFYGSPSVVHRITGGNNDKTTTFTVPDMSGYNGFAVVLLFINGSTYNNVTVKPMIRLASVTDATFTPYSNICPIYGRTGQNVTVTGKNLLSEDDYDKLSDVGDGVYESNAIGYNNYYATKALKAGTYTFSADVLESTSGINRVYTFVNGAINTKIAQAEPSGAKANITFTLTEPTTVAFVKSGNDRPIRLQNIQLETGSTATTYEPYTGTTYTRAFVDGQGNTLTVYGGEDEIVGGVLTVDRIMVEFDGSSDENWKYEIISATQTGNFYIAMPSTVKTAQYQATGLICNTCPASTINRSEPGRAFISNARNFNLTIADAIGVSTAANFKTWLQSNHVQVVCELVTPQTYQLTPNEVTTLIGTNHVWSDAGEVTVEYGTDPYTMVNDTPFASRPLIKVTGYGQVNFGDVTITITGTAGVVTYIDCDLMECYRMSGGAITPANQYVTFTGTDFPTIPTGKTRVTSASTISKVEVVPRWWII